jgi:hypothetical protein
MKKKRVAVALCVVLCGAGLATGQTVWQQYPGNPIIGPGDPGEWDETGHAVTAVIFDGSLYHMWFTSFTSYDVSLPTDIGHATSPDGIAWAMDPENPVLTRGAPGEWDEYFLYNTAVLYDGAQFHMWYQGSDADEISRAGYATSPDGSVWTKYPGNPVMDAGPPASWEAWGPRPMTVIREGDGYRMWYAANGQWPVNGRRLFYAESEDGITWTKHGTPIFQFSSEGWDRWVDQPMVIRDGSTYHMWYAGGPENLKASIGYAVSTDGLTWTRYENNPVVEAIGMFVFSPSVIFDGSTFRMWYSYWDGEIDWVGLTTSGSIDFTRFIPAAAVAAGAHGAFFQTDVDVSNAGDHSAVYQFAWLPRGEDNSDPLSSETFSLDAGMSVRYENVLTSVFGLEPDSLGALAITASSPDLLAMSRTCNLPSAKAAGSYGQAMPAIPVDEFIPTGERRRILFGTEHADMRTNVGCQNGSGQTTTVNLELFDAAGTSLETMSLTLPPLGNKQINAIFEDYAPVTGAVDVWTNEPDRRFYCYGSVLDNVTSDPTTIPPQ